MADAAAFDDRLARLRLIRTGGVGPISYRQLIARFGGAEAALAALPDLARRGGGRSPTVPSRDAIAREIETVRKLGARYLLIDDARYPALLAAIATAPPALIVRGELGLLERPTVAMVGARNASAAGARFARGLAHALGEVGLVVASGLARGIDTAAHEGSLESGTIGVIAGGIDIAYPPENAALQDAVAERGLLVSEQPPGTEPRARHFPSRNRIIAGLACGTVVVEAAPKSGSLITARMAADYGREVMAVPGSPLDPRAQGCNLLIREGATLIQSADDVLELVRPLDARAVAEPPPAFAAPVEEADEGDRAAIAELLGPTPVAIDEIVRLSGRSSAAVQMVLLELELAGRLVRHAGGRVAL